MSDESKTCLEDAGEEMRRNMERFQGSTLGKDRPARKVPSEPRVDSQPVELEEVSAVPFGTPLEGTAGESQELGQVQPPAEEDPTSDEGMTLLTPSGKPLGEVLPSMEEVQQVIAEPEERIDVEQFIHELNAEAAAEAERLAGAPIDEGSEEEGEAIAEEGEEGEAELLSAPEPAVSEKAQERHRLLD